MSKTTLKKGDFGIFPTGLCRGLPALQQIVLIWLWDHTNKEGTCFPSLATLSIECGMSKSAVCSNLKKLEDGGLIKRTKRPIKRNGHIEYTSTIYEVFKEKQSSVAKEKGGCPLKRQPCPPKRQELKPVNALSPTGREGSERSPQSPQFSSSFSKKKTGFGDPDISKTLKYLRKKVGIESFIQNKKEERAYGRNLVDLMKQITSKEFDRRMKLILCNKFKFQNCNSLKYIYSQIKGFLETPEDSKNKKGKEYNIFENFCAGSVRN